MTVALVVSPQLKWKAPESAALSALEGARNCACAGGAGLANWWLRTNAEQRGDPVPPLVTHHAFRLAAGNPKRPDGTPSGLASSQVLKALTAFGVPAKRHYKESFTLVRDALQRAAAVGICVHYPTIKAFEGGRWSGQPTFEGEHFLDLFGWTPADPTLQGRNSTTDHDSLFDDRCKAWGCAPDGPQDAPFALFRKAMGDFLVGGKPIGTDKGVFVIVEAPASPTPPEPSTPETDAEKIARLEAELAACKEANP